MDERSRTQKRRTETIEQHPLMNLVRKGRVADRARQSLNDRYDLSDLELFDQKYRFRQRGVVWSCVCAALLLGGSLILSAFTHSRMVSAVLTVLFAGASFSGLVFYLSRHGLELRTREVLDVIWGVAGRVGEALDLGPRTVLTEDIDEEGTSLQNLVDEKLTDHARRCFSTDGCSSSEEVDAFLETFEKEEFDRCWSDFEREALPFVELGFRIYGYDQYVRWAVEWREK